MTERTIWLAALRARNRSVASRLIAEQIIPEKSGDDALHISCAAVHEMDYLLTWNRRHIANAHNRRRIRDVLSALGYGAPVICTPEELIDNE